MSLQRRLLLTLGLAFTLLWLVAAGLLFVDLRRQVTATLDQRLAASARMVAGLVANRPELADTGPDPARLTAPETDGVACQVRAAGGRVLLRTGSAAGRALGTPTPGYQTRTINDQHWRLYTLRHEDLFITTADRMSVRRELEQRMLLVMVAPFALALVGGLMALWLGIRRGLRPLHRLREALARRRPESLDPVHIEQAPAELAPVIDTLNELLEQVAEVLAHERRFTSNAAHELRTPLTGIKTHLQLARRQQGPEREQAIQYAEAGAQRLAHLVDQLLTLARVESDAAEEPPAALVDTAVREALADLPDTRRLHVTGLASELTVAAPAALVSTALRNLLTNALRHTPEASAVDLIIEAEPERIQLRVEDRGSGGTQVAEGHLTRRFERQGEHAGAGLGLAIVEAIARHYDGGLRFARSAGGGLVAILELPRAPDQRAS